MSAVEEVPQNARAGLVLRALSNPWARAIGVALLYALAAHLSLSFALGSRRQPVFYPASGVALALVLLAPSALLRRVSLAGIGMGCLGWTLFFGLPAIAAIGSALTAVVGAAAGAAVVRTMAPQDPGARSFGGMATLLGPATFVASAAAATAAVLTVMWMSEAGANLTRVWTARWLADTVGVFLATPAILWCFTGDRVIRTGWFRVEAVLILIGATLASAAIFGMRHTSTGISLALLCLPIPMLMLAAARLGPAGTSATALVVGALAAWCTDVGRGPISALNATPRDEIFGIQAYMAIITSSGLLLAAAVTDWRRTERLLRGSEGRYREFVSHSSEGVWCVDLARSIPTSLPAAEQIDLFYRDARLSECNDAMARMYGLSHASELANTPLSQLMVREDPRNDAYLRAFIDSGYRLENAESHERDVAGNDKYFLNSLVGVVEDGRIARAWGTQRDVTTTRRAEHELAKTRARLAAAMDAADLASWTLDLRTGTLTFDDAVRRLYSLPPGTESPLPAEFFLERMNPEDAAQVRQRLEGAWRGNDRYRAEYRVPQPGGGQRWMASRGSVQTDSRGVPITLTGFCADVTEIKNAASEREHLQAQLRHSQKLESLGLMAGGIAHDFNNLLVGVLGSVGIAMGQVKAGDPVAATLSNIEQSARRAADLTMQLLAYAGKSRFVKEPVNLTRLVAGLLPMLQSRSLSHAPFTADLSPSVPTVLADPTQLQQVVINLASNALEAIGDGGEVRLRTGRVEVTRQYLEAECLNGEQLEPGTFAFLDVEDNGRGMDEATVGRIFDPFYTTKFTGRGLGLAVVLGIVRGHQGTICVTSKPGGGSRFRVLLPMIATPHLAATSNRVPAIEPKPAPARAKGGRILIIDDEKLVREVTAKMLQRAGWETVAASEGAQAIALLSGEGAPFDAVVLDATMPGMSGMDVLREIRRVRPGLPVLLSSGYTQEAIDGGREIKPDGFLQKPFSPEALARAVSAVVASPREAG